MLRWHSQDHNQRTSVIHSSNPGTVFLWAHVGSESVDLPTWGQIARKVASTFKYLHNFTYMYVYIYILYMCVYMLFIVFLNVAPGSWHKHIAGPAFSLSFRSLSLSLVLWMSDFIQGPPEGSADINCRSAARYGKKKPLIRTFETAADQ